MPGSGERLAACTIEPDPEEMRALLHAVTERLIEFIGQLDTAPAQVMDDVRERTEKLRHGMPKFGRPAEDVLDCLFGEAIANGNNSAGPGYLAYVPGGGIVHAAVADLIAKTLNRFVGLWAGSPGLVQLELNVLRWFCDLVGYGPESGGILCSGGSMATFSAVFTARRRKLGDDLARARIYTSDQAHHSVRKAAVLAGFAADRVHVIASDENFRLDIDALEKAIQSDSDQRPFLVVAQAGSTNTGSVDDLGGLADFCDLHDLWLHVDAAYGGFFLLTDHGRDIMAGLERAHSITLDPHKGLFLPYGTGALLVRDESDLRAAHAMTADYLSDIVDQGANTDFCMISPELSREARGLRVWLPLQLLGYDTFRGQLLEKLRLARWAYQALLALPDVVVVSPPDLTIVAFRARFARDEDALNKRWMAAVNARRRVLLSGTSLNGAFAIRICILCFRTHFEHVEMAMRDLAEELTILRDHKS
ncbi:MAG: aminotransferase class I/II-fold pyridoxal phosphate-dependent enzyme [Rhodospirillum sp.]|nr:aminotransferase class I/II-fold pyridoxal phosphate-dependent enzyme [Rhodospirillum sp.]MCF8488351.1 aminotransferase class I/II-fold pyridoxal phosphate-dependent enzyme [Rhodospirillum sp.]